MTMNDEDFHTGGDNDDEINQTLKINAEKMMLMVVMIVMNRRTLRQTGEQTRGDRHVGCNKYLFISFITRDVTTYIFIAKIEYRELPPFDHYNDDDADDDGGNDEHDVMVVVRRMMSPMIVIMVMMMTMIMVVMMNMT
ncbi:hypothetical protein PoB_006092400 [Plakobranchus ocellatus]|uniref:Uncharacterized protein n=1 Tax=Plakobranchus ocellatus TaxID=259542 RepID=A0AAV4CRC5_9GAST|nr:hypothetical protein PoB_006092400 [Plakobranchus ocellatus]